MKKILVILVCILAACSNENDFKYAVIDVRINYDNQTFRPGDEMYEALIPYKLFFDKEFQRPDSIVKRG